MAPPLSDSTMMSTILCIQSLPATTPSSSLWRTSCALPNQGRSKEQRFLGVGTYGGGAQQQNLRNETIARVLYMHECNPAALRAGLISAVSDDPCCIMWLGGTYSIRKFVDVSLQHKIVQMVVTFTDSPIYLNAEAGYTAEQWHEWIRSLLAPQVSVARRAYEEKCQAPTTTELAAATWLASLWPLLIRQQQQLETLSVSSRAPTR